MHRSFTALCLLLLLSAGVLAQEQLTETTTVTTNATSSSTSEAPKNFADASKKRKISSFDSKKESADPTQATTLAEDYPKNEFYLGYSNQQVDTFGRTTYHGFQGAYVRNVTKMIGIRADFSYAQNNNTFRGTIPFPSPNGSFDFEQTVESSVVNVLGGIQIKDNASTNRFKPFAFALGGVAFNRTEIGPVACVGGPCPLTPTLVSNVTFRDTGLAGAFGGGLDIRVNRRVDLRAFQIDYNPIYSNSRVDNNFRIGIGVVFR